MADRSPLDDFTLLDAAIGESLSSTQPPARARERILHLISELSKGPVGARSIRHTSGVTGCIVERDVERGSASILLHFSPGGVMNGHGHHGAEKAFVVKGSCRIGDALFLQGDFHSVLAGEEHGDIVSDEGCVLLVTADERDLAAF